MNHNNLNNNASRRPPTTTTRYHHVILLESNFYRTLFCVLTGWVLTALWLHYKIFWMDTTTTRISSSSGGGSTTTSWAADFISNRFFFDLKIQDLEAAVLPPPSYTKFIPQQPQQEQRTTTTTAAADSDPAGGGGNLNEKPSSTSSTKTKKKKDGHQKPLNILLLYADDWRWDSLGVHGTNPFIQTPFLDRLATGKGMKGGGGGGGIRFRNNMVTTSICWMSRATLHTGLYASKHKGWMPDEPYWYKYHWYDSFPHLMKTQNNYSMAHVGKWDYEYFYDIQPLWETYNYTRIYHGKHWYDLQELQKDVITQTKVTGQPLYDDTNYKIHKVLDENDDPKEVVHVTDRTVADAMEFLKYRPKDRPFMLTVAFFPPHSVDGTEGQFYPQPETANAYRDYYSTKLHPPVPPDFTIQNMNESFFNSLPKSIFPNEGNNNEARTRWHIRFDDLDKYDEMMKRYYRMITGVDTASEKIVTELERQGILNDTLVIFTTDNGFYHGEHGLAGKWFPHEESIRVPLIVMDPRAPPDTRGSVRDELTLNIDLAPTLLRAAQTSIPPKMQGRDISELYLARSDQPPSNNGGPDPAGTDARKTKEASQEPPTPWREEFYYEYPQFWDEIFLPAATALVRKSHKYIRWGSSPIESRVEQLFDLVVDPKEETDVSKNPKYESILKEMRQRHDELQKECCSDVDKMNTMTEKRTPGANPWMDPVKDVVADRASQLQHWHSTEIDKEQY